MLTELHVVNLGIIADLTVPLGAGLTAITGGTGAGKTLLVEALSLLLGGRADPALVRGLVAGALAQFPMDDQVTVRLHPEDLHRCRTLLGEEGVTLPDLRWVADPAVERGGCLLEGRERILDGRLDVALERAYRALGGVGA